VRIPLDYYRILGLPVQATDDQLQQAHRDRALQLPRREYSEGAIASRKQLLDEAYTVLADTAQRSAYNASFLANTYEDAETTSGAMPLDPATNPYASSITIQESQLVGALLVLLELGEYELVLKLGQPYLTSRPASSEQMTAGTTRSDVLLTVALSYLELGREQWHQGQYEGAAESLQAGHALLQRDGLFGNVRNEMQSDLYKLRPYRILELLALPEQNQLERRRGLTLLQDMLNDRGGIDGLGDDQSGLQIDDFLRFIQQLRSYLSTAEQQTLFESEAQRPSAVATYLAVYALLARGFAYRQPALVRRAKNLLQRLSSRQDVFLEQAVCSLLLGQTEDASYALDHSQEAESIRFIREHSHGSPDCLPGLCLYSERWLQNEVFPHFSDLAQQMASLKDYFADSQVQGYLEELPSDSADSSDAVAPAVYGYSGAIAPMTAPAEARNHTYEQAAGSDGPGGRFATATTATIESRLPASRPSGPAPRANGTNGSGAMPTAERVSQLSPEGRLTGSGGGRSQPSSPAPSSPRRPSPAAPIRDNASPYSPDSDSSFSLARLLFLVALGILGLAVVWFLLSSISRALFRGPTLTGDQLQISLNEPPIEIPDPTAEPATPDPTEPLSVEGARSVIDAWLAAKRASMGPTNDISQLSNVLTGSVLVERQGMAEDARQNGLSYSYRHSVEDVRVLPINAQTPNQAQVDAVVVEATNDEPASRLLVRYDMIRQDGTWRIQGITAQPDGATTEFTTPDEETLSDTDSEFETPLTPAPNPLDNDAEVPVGGPNGADPSGIPPTNTFPQPNPINPSTPPTN
jgi:curved DNA-binding protein CbpA